jgi:hypothetical protein
MAANREILMKFITGQAQKAREDVSRQGYKDNSPYRNNPSNTIYGTPEGTSITMDNVSKRLYATDNEGNSQILEPNSGVHYFPGSIVKEKPLAQDGGESSEQDPEMIYLDKFNTPLTDKEKKEFDTWVAKESKRQGRNIMMDKGAYDIQGFWKSGDYKNMDKDNHGTDDWKKPNHPTFSNESKYHGINGFYGGNWTENGGYQPSKQTLELYGPDYYNWMFGKEPNRPEHLDLSRFISGNNSPSPFYYKTGGLLSKTIKCSNCGWSWKAADGGNDVYTCHKCGNENTIIESGGEPKPGEKDFQKVMDWYNKYTTSPRYLENLIKSGYKDPQAIIDERLANINTTKFKHDESRLGSYYRNNKIHYSPIKDQENFPNSEPDSSLAHEFGHSSIDTGKSIFDGFKAGYNRYDFEQLKNRNKNPKISRGEHENYADQKALQYEAEKQGLYKAGYDEFTEEILDKLKDSGHKERALQNYSKEDLIWLLNNIAQNDNQPQLPIAQEGVETGSTLEGLSDEERQRKIDENTAYQLENIKKIREEERIKEEESKRKAQEEHNAFIKKNFNPDAVEKRKNLFDKVVSENEYPSTSFHEEWMNSPQYKKLLTESTVENNSFDLYNDIRNRNLEELKGKKINTSEDNYKPGAVAYFSPEKRTINYPFDRNELDTLGGNFSNDFNRGVAVHEKSHFIDNLFAEGQKKFRLNSRLLRKELKNREDDEVSAIPLKDVDLINSLKVPKTDDNKFKYDYFTEPTEVRARLNEVRDNLYNSGNKEFLNRELNEEDLKSLYNDIDLNTNQGLKDLNDYFGKEGTIKLLNSISQNDQQFQLPVAQEGLETFNKNVDNALEFQKNWMNSAMYKKMLNKSTEDDWIDRGYAEDRLKNLQDLINSRTYNIRNSNDDYGPTGEEANFYPNTGVINIYKGGRENKEEEQENISHETSHATDSPRFSMIPFRGHLIPQSDIDLIEKYKPSSYKETGTYLRATPKGKDNIKKLNLITQQTINYMTQPTETRARLNVIRQFAKENNIYDPFTQEITPSVYEKLFKKENLPQGALDLRSMYTKDELIDLLNTVSQNDNNTDDRIAIAKRGGTWFGNADMMSVSNKYQEAGTVKPANTSDKNTHTREMAQRVVQLAEERIRNNNYVDVPKEIEDIAKARGESAFSCIGGVCTVLKDAGVMDKVDWSNTHFSEHAKEYGFTANQGWGVKGIENLEPGDVLQYSNKVNKEGNYYPGHSQIYLGKDASGQLRFFDNFWGTERTKFEDDIKELLDRSRKKTELSATIYKVNPYDDSNPLGLTPEEKKNYDDKQQFIEKESKSKASYKWSIAPNAKDYNDTTKRVMDKFIEFANDNDKVNDLVKKTGKSKEEIQDSLLNVFGELGAENNWTTSRGKGLGSRLENIAESVLTSVGGGKKLSVGPGQIKYNSIPEDLKEKFNIESPNDLYNLDKVLPLMTAMDLRDKQVLENWGKNNTLSKNLFGWTRQAITDNEGNIISGGFTADQLASDTGTSLLDNGVGRYSPYLRNQYSSIASGNTWEGGNDWIPFNEGTLPNFTEGRFTKSGQDEMRVKYERDPGSYPYKVEQNWRDNLNRFIQTNADGAVELNEVVISRPKKT